MTSVDVEIMYLRCDRLLCIRNSSLVGVASILGKIREAKSDVIANALISVLPSKLNLVEDICRNVRRNA